MLNMKPNDKILFEEKDEKKYRETLLINDELNPKLVKVLKEWYDIFTEGEKKMYPKGVAKFVQGVSQYNDPVDEDDNKVTSFLSEYDKDNKGYVSEEEFISFYKKALQGKKLATVWRNLRNMKVREDLKKMDEPYDYIFIESDKLPRYQLGNDINFINNIIKQYYKNPEENKILIEFLLFITTNDFIYNEVINMFTPTDKENYVNNIIKEENKFIELNYVFIIIESILQDLELKMYLKSPINENMINFDDKEYKLLKEPYEPFDKEENEEKKLEFLKNLIKAENFNKIIKSVNNLLLKLSQTESDNNIYSILFNCCLRGIKIINSINMIYKINKNNITDDYNINSFKELKENYIYDLGFADLSQLLKDFDYQKELNDVSYSDLVNNIFIYLNKEKKENKKNNFDIICLNLLIDLLSTKKDLFNEYYTNEEKKEKMKKLFIKLFSDNDKEKSKFFINYLDKKKNTAMANENYNYIIFLYKLCNSLLNNLITVQSQLEEKDDKEKIEIFTPQSEFFDLYNNLNQSVENLVNAKIMTKNEIENESESFSNKIYDLLMKELTSDNKEDNSTKNKIILNFLKLLEISVNKDENKTNAILLEKNKTSNVSLFDLIYQKYFSTLCSKGGGEKNSTEDHTELISKSEDENKTDKNENEENNKFILLEEIKQTKPEDDSINEELNKYYSEIIFNALSYSNDQSHIPKLISLINILKKLSKKEKNGNDSDSDDRESRHVNISSSFIQKTT